MRRPCSVETLHFVLGQGVYQPFRTVMAYDWRVSYADGKTLCVTVHQGAFQRKGFIVAHVKGVFFRRPFWI